MKYVNRYLTITFVSIISLLTSCTYDYEYPTEITYHIEDNGFHEMIIDTLEKYEASIVYYDREKYIYEYDRNGNELRHFKMDLLYRDTFKSASNASYIIIKVSMDAGEMGYICTEPINIKFGRNEIILNENTPVHVEFNELDETKPIKYHIVDNGFHEMIIDTLNMYGASIIYYDREKYIYEYDENGNELRNFKMDLLYRENFDSDPKASYIIVKVAMDAGEMGYICTDPIELTRLRYEKNEIELNENTPVHVELNIPEDNLPTRYVLTEDETLDKVLLPVVQANGYSDYMTSFYVHEMNKDDVEIKEVNVKKAMLGELQITSDDSTYLIVEIALYKPNGMYIGSVDVDKLFPITAHKLLKIDLNSDIKVKSSCFADCEIITP